VITQPRWMVIGLVLCLLIPALAVMTGQNGFFWPATATELDRVLLQIRIGRVAAALVVGAALSCAGAVLQAVLRNPLADPYVLGVSSGGAVGATLAITLGLASHTVLALPLTAFAAAIITLTVVFRLASRHGDTSVHGLILSGVVVSSMLSSVLMVILSFSRNDRLHGILWWMLGNLQINDMRVLAGCAGCCAVACVAALALARDLNALTLGTEMAHNLGVRTRLVVCCALGTATLAAAAAVALAGLIGFVGLIVPHAVRHVTGSDHRRLLPAAALAGGAFLVVCDTVARSLMPGQEIPVGVITALTGGPFFLILLRRRREGWIA